MKKLGDVAKVIRSKNSGPFELTIDVLFDSPKIYGFIRDSGIISKETICRLYKIGEDRICNIVFFDPAMGFKVTMLRDVSSGSIGDRDVYGAQQHAPLMNLEIPLPSAIRNGPDKTKR